MKFKQHLVLLLASVAFITSSDAQVASQDSIISKLFTALKTKNEASYLALYPTGPQFSKMVRTMMESMLNSEQMKQMMAMDPKSKDLNIDSLINVEVAKMDKPETFGAMQMSFKMKFQEAIENGEKKGVDWSKAKLTSYTVDSTKKTGGEMEMFSTSGIKNLGGVIDFTVGDSAYQMQFDKIIFIPAEGGWFGGEFPQVIRKGESFATAEEETKDVEINSVQEESAPIPPPPSVKPKTKAKSKTSSPKAKSKTKS